MTVSNNEEFIDLKEAAQYFEVSPQTIRRWIKDGRLQAELRESVYGKQYFIPRHQIDKVAQIQDVVSVERTVEIASLLKAMESYFSERENRLMDEMGALREEVAAAREQISNKQEQVTERMENHDRLLMETLRAIQEQTATLQAEKSKRKFWPWSK